MEGNVVASQFARTELLYGEEAIERLKDKRVAVPAPTSLYFPRDNRPYNVNN